MKTKLNIQSLIQQAKESGVHIPTGLTNDNYIVNEGDQKFVVRIPKAMNAHLFDYSLEDCVIKAINPLNIDIETYYYDSLTGIKISPYIENARQYTPKDLNRVAPLIKSLHNAKIQTNRRYDILKAYEDYKAGLLHPLFDLEPFEHFIQDASKISDTWILCHNDIVPGNLLFTENDAYLIDYEYACDNDPLFDVMSFITENNINDTNDRDTFYMGYFGSLPSARVREKLFTFECAQNVLWCTWAMRAYELEGLLVFKDIAITKYLNLLKAIRNKES